MSSGGRRAAGGGKHRSRQQGGCGQDAGQHARTWWTVGHPHLLAGGKWGNSGRRWALARQARNVARSPATGKRPTAPWEETGAERSAARARGRSAAASSVASTCAEASASGIGQLPEFSYSAYAKTL